MKKLSVIACLLFGVLSVSAQHQIYPFFDDKGAVRIETVELNAAADTLVKVFHRADDIVWSRIVYRIIDMRYKQNYQLYFPVRYDDPQYRSLFKIVVDAIVDGMPIYRKAQDNIKPQFDEASRIGMAEIPTLFMVDDPTADYSEDTCHYNVECSDAMLLHYDKNADKMSFHFYPYESFVKNQLKYLIQEIVFFDRHTSRLYTKIIAIAPLQSDKIFSKESDQVMAALHESVLFWIPFDELRPYMAKQYMIPQQNDNKRLTFDEFFAKKLYTSYILGDSNMYNRMILEYSKSEDEVKKEQQRIFDELLNFEQDLWEY
ncbi:MAG: gliding motility protein GldN [Paludibacteraceae bacterium]|nr:gliding motility protein GldN [Paludibacteraceae bacterium]